MTKTTPQPVSPTPKRFPRAHKYSPAAANASIIQRKNLKSLLKAKVAKKRAEKMRARLLGVRRVHFDDVVCATRTKGTREVRCLKVPFKERKPAVIDEKHKNWLRGLRARTLEKTKEDRRVEMWHATSRAAARAKAYYFV